MILKIYENKYNEKMFVLEINGVIYYSYYLKSIIECAKTERILNKNVQKLFEYILSTDKFEILLMSLRMLMT